MGKRTERALIDSGAYKAEDFAPEPIVKPTKAIQARGMGKQLGSQAEYDAMLAEQLARQSAAKARADEQKAIERANRYKYRGNIGEP